MTELHLHIDGSIRPASAYEMAREIGLTTESDTIETFASRMIAPADCGDLNAYLDRFEIPLQLVRDRSALIRMTRELVEDLANEGHTYAELRFAPHSSVGWGLSQKDACDAVLEGVEVGLRNHPNLEIGVILCCMRGLTAEKNIETVRLVADYKGSRICAADLCGAEALFPTHAYSDVFREAARLSIPYTIHAGEADGPQSVIAALEMGASRIGHGVRAIEDPDLVRRLADRKIPLEVCVTSNIQTNICATAAEHPLRKLYDANVRVTISSDNRTVSNTTLTKEIAIVRETMHFSPAELAQMESYASEARFLK